MQNASHPFVIQTLTQRIPNILDETIRGIVRLKGEPLSREYCCRMQILRQKFVNSADITAEGSYASLLDSKTDANSQAGVLNHTWNTDYLFPLDKTHLSQLSTFFVENYFYRLLLDALDYWSFAMPSWTPAASVLPAFAQQSPPELMEVHLRDPFLAAKLDSLEVIAIIIT